MFRSLRNRLLLSHILPLLVIIPLIGIGLIYTLETRVLLPRLATNMVSDARLLAEISRTEYELWGNPLLFETMLSRVRLDPSIRVMFLDSEGYLLYSTDFSDKPNLGNPLSINGIDLARSGSEVVLSNYSGFNLNDILIDVLAPVTSSDGPVLGIVRVTYRFESIYDILWQMRLLIAGILGAGLLTGALIGLVLALSISRPVQRVTHALYDVAQGQRKAPLPEEGPSELREQARAVNYLAARLDSLEQARRQLLANLVHELGRPLGALRSAIHALSKGASQDPGLFRELTTGMDEETIRLQHVIEDLAHLHDQNLGVLELQRAPLVLNEWLPSVLVPWGQAALEKGLQWNVDLPPGLPTLLADPVRLAQVIGNLADNAIKYTPPHRAVNVSAGVSGENAWIRFDDQGPGINPDEYEKIFTPFYRGTQEKRIKQGMGLGLSIAHDFAAAHGGTITVEKAPDQGSRFTLWIPIQNS